MNNQTFIIPHKHRITVSERSKLKRHKPLLLWFTGLSGSGKSSIADRTEQLLSAKGIHTYLLDGDNIRTGLNEGLSFTEADRHENLRRIAEVSKLFLDAGIVVLGAFVSPLKQDREMVKNIVGASSFVEIFIDTPLEECERRDVKGLYKKARAGEIENFTGISAPYEAPEHPDIMISTEGQGIDEAALTIINYVFRQKNIQL